MPFTRSLATSALALLLFTVGCAPTNQQQGMTGTRNIGPEGDCTGLYASLYKNSATGNPVRSSASPDTSIGYASLSANALRPFGTGDGTRVYVDRNVLAQAAAKVALSVPGVRHATVTVTDRHVMVGVTLNTPRPSETLNQVKKGVQSITPRYYRVSVTTDEAAVQRDADRSTSAGRTPANLMPGRNVDRP